MTIALLLMAAWAGALVLARRAPAGGSPAAAARARRRNGALLALTLLTSGATCAAPVVSLVAGLGEVAEAPPEEKAPRLERVLERTRPATLLALLGLPLLGGGLMAHRANRRRLARAAEAARVADAF